ncbi:DUF6597 domain-containing transcriptional factor [Rufibacter tibetensis]|uniref:DUF6597 domain-containing protein n=1 Tax=Rufibacter tibetensis TaxID=512763 RepID=A0A0P0D437_9BACT|nr:DUF6597 domain-containing transcriptional factor [Rufibacter tibetensis]ALJ01692.1 hypothetical protein DC20_21820 [Rufibacter tibetensis]
MQFPQYQVRKSLRCYVNCIMMDASEDPSGSLEYPLYADGYPGIMFQKAEHGLFMLPAGKKLSGLFLYGQTLSPMALSAQGRFQFVVFQLYPFASKYLLNMDPKALNDECYDLLQLKNIEAGKFHGRLLAADDLPTQVEVISDLVEALLSAHKLREDDRIQATIHHIIRNKGMGRSKICAIGFPSRREPSRGTS